MFKLLYFVASLVVLAAANPRLLHGSSYGSNYGTSYGSLSNGNSGLSSQNSDVGSSSANSNDDPQSSRSSSSLSSSSSFSSSSLSSSSLSSLPSRRIGSVFASPSGSVIQHHLLAAQTLPLPLTISARPGLRTVIAPETISIHQPTLARVGEVVQKIPTAVSHQSQSVVHNHARVVTPIVAPAVRTITSQVVRAYHTPLVYAQPLINVHN